MILKIADLYFDITMPQKLIDSRYNDYICSEAEKIDSCITVTKEDVISEYNLSKKQDIPCNDKKELGALALYRKICAFLLNRNAFLMHGALIEYEGRGYLFTAQSGTGKTTHIMLWKQLFGDDKVTVVNGDKPIIRFVDGKVYAYGTPWCGKERYNVNTRVELCAITFVERDLQNSIFKIADTAALPRILSQVMVSDSANLARQLELLDQLFENVPMYLLRCNMALEAAEVAYNGMHGER